MFTYQTVNISGSVHMAYTFGRPVVATSVGLMTDVVEDGVTGYLAEPREAHSVADAMLRGAQRSPVGGPPIGWVAAAARHAELGSSWSSVAEKRRSPHTPLTADQSRDHVAARASSAAI